MKILTKTMTLSVSFLGICKINREKIGVLVMLLLFASNIVQATTVDEATPNEHIIKVKKGDPPKELDCWFLVTNQPPVIDKSISIKYPLPLQELLAIYESPYSELSLLDVFIAREVLLLCSHFFEIYTYDRLTQKVYEELKHSSKSENEGVTYSLSDFYISLAEHNRKRGIDQNTNYYYQLYLDSLEKQYDMDESKWAITLFDAYLNEEHYPAFFAPHKAIKYLQFMNQKDRYALHISMSICDHLPELVTNRDVCSIMDDPSHDHHFMIPRELIKKPPVVSF